MTSKPYDVVLIPEEALVREAVTLSEKCKPYGTYFTLNQTDYFAHLSMYMLQLNKPGLEVALAKLATIAEKTEAVKLSPSYYNYENEYLDVEYIKGSKLTKLQEEVLIALNPIRDGLRQKDQERLLTIEGIERSNLLAYGYRSIGNKFNPHLTFARLTNDLPKVLETFPPLEIFAGIFPSLALFEMGDNGTCVRLVKAWNLKV